MPYQPTVRSGGRTRWQPAAAARWARACLALVAVLPAYALPEVRNGLLDLPAVITAAAAVDRERFPNADDVLIDDTILSEYQADGTAVTVTTPAKVLTERAAATTRSSHAASPCLSGTASFSWSR